MTQIMGILQSVEFVSHLGTSWTPNVVRIRLMGPSLRNRKRNTAARATILEI